MKTTLAIFGYGYGYEQMLNDHLPRHQFYCDKWNIQLSTCTTPIVPKDHPYWNKINYINQLLQTDTDQIIYMDCDCIIRDMDKDLSSVLPDWAWLGLTIHPFKSEMTLWHFNCGVMIIKNTPEAKLFFKMVYTLKDKYPDPNNWGEQTVINHLLLDEKQWQKGLYILTHRYNCNHHNMPHCDSYITAWHGNGSPSERRAKMKDYVKTLDPFYLRNV